MLAFSCNFRAEMMLLETTMVVSCLPKRLLSIDTRIDPKWRIIIQKTFQTREELLRTYNRAF